MNIRIQTASGSTYLFKEKEMTWQRRNANPGHETILGLFQEAGMLTEWPEFKIGERLNFATVKEWNGEPDTIHTTRVVLIMDVGESAVW